MSILAIQLVELGTRWVDELDIRSSTRRAYEFEVRRLARWAGGERDASLPGLPVTFLTAFLDLLAATEQDDFARVGLERPARDSSVHQAKRILSAFFEWAAAGGVVPAGVGYACRRWRLPEGRSLPEPEAPAQRTMARAKAAGLEKIRNQFIVALARWAGARPQDISNLRRSDVRLCGKVLQVQLPDGKNSPVDSFLPPSAAAAWKTLRRQGRSGEFAITKVGTGERLTPSRVARIIMETGPKSENARALRSEGIQQFHEAGWPEESIRAQLRRQSVRLSLPTEAKAARLNRVSRIAPPGVNQ